MKKSILLSLMLFVSVTTFAQSKFSTHEISLNGFRNPSIGAEYRYKQVSFHAGYYLTNFESGITTKFIRSGVSYWFLPVGKLENPSSFYASLSYARGLSKDYKNQNAAIAETGFRWMVYKGLNLRLGVAALKGEGKDIKINPTPGISYSIFL
jgi:hypothetical protein